MQDQVSTLKNQLYWKVINTLPGKLEKKHHEEIFASQTTTNGSSVVQTSSVIQATSVKTQHDNINMNQDSAINIITTAQNLTQAITKTDVPPTSTGNTKTNSISKMNLIQYTKNLQNRTTQMKILKESQL